MSSFGSTPKKSIAETWNSNPMPRTAEANTPRSPRLAVDV
jgi:hypothetical protein